MSLMRMRRAVRTAALLATAWMAGSANAQLTADFTYYGVNRPAPFTVSAPEGEAAKITLHVWGEAEPIAEADVEAGSVDLSVVFPSLWTEQDARVLYAQLHGGGEPIGSPVVLQPMTSVRMAQARGRTVSFPPKRPGMEAYSGLIAYSEMMAEIVTSEGTMQMRFRPDHAPNTVRHIMGLIGGGFYRDIIFHRIIPNFVIQVGDPRGEGIGGPGFQVDLEDSKLPHDFGVVSMARSGDPDSGGSQVFVCLSRAGTSMLDGSYTAFAEIVSGAEVITAIGAAETGAQDRPLQPPVWQSARLLPAPPFGTGPDRVTPPETPAVER